MNRRKFFIGFSLAAMLIVTLACSALSFSTTPTVSNIRMATDKTGSTSTSSYAPGDPFYVFADLSNIKTGSVIEAQWYVVNAEGVNPNTQINTSDYNYKSGVDYVYFQLTTNDGSDWPVGTYRVEVYLDGNKVGEQGFTVQ